MSKLSKKQQEDLFSTKYFIPSTVNFQTITSEDIKIYFEWSDRGMHKEKVTTEAMQTNTGLSALYWGKQRRDLQVSSYLEDWGYNITSVDFVDEPKELVSWLSRVMKKPGLLEMWRIFNEPYDSYEKSESFAVLLKFANLWNIEEPSDGGWA